MAATGETKTTNKQRNGGFHPRTIINTITKLKNMTTQKQIRAAFWQYHPDHEAHAIMWGIKTAPHNRHNVETRTAFVDFVDYLARSGEITEKLASCTTL
jgi:hypothetical protein